MHKEFSTIFLRLPKEYLILLQQEAAKLWKDTGRETKAATIINEIIHKYLKERKEKHEEKQTKA